MRSYARMAVRYGENAPKMGYTEIELPTCLHRWRSVTVTKSYTCGFSYGFAIALAEMSCHVNIGQPARSFVAADTDDHPAYEEDVQDVLEPTSIYCSVWRKHHRGAPCDAILGKAKPGNGQINAIELESRMQNRPTSS